MAEAAFLDNIDGKDQRKTSLAKGKGSNKSTPIAIARTSGGSIPEASFTGGSRGGTEQKKIEDGHETKPSSVAIDPSVRSRNSLSNKAMAKAQVAKARALRAKNA